MSVSTRALRFVTDALRAHRETTRTGWRVLSSGGQALLVLAHLRKGETYRDLAVGFGVGTTSAYRYLPEALQVLASLASCSCDAARERRRRLRLDRKSTRLNSSHMSISYAVFCLKKKKTTQGRTTSGMIT